MSIKSIIISFIIVFFCIFLLFYYKFYFTYENQEADDTATVYKTNQFDLELVQKVNDLLDFNKFNQTEIVIAQKQEKIANLDEDLRIYLWLRSSTRLIREINDKMQYCDVICFFKYRELTAKLDKIRTESINKIKYVNMMDIDLQTIKDIYEE